MKKIQLTAKTWDPHTFNPARPPPAIPYDSILPPRHCSSIFPAPLPPKTRIIQVETFQYITASDGINKSYSNQDGLVQFGSSEILDPSTVSYMNLFINGMLQPSSAYSVSEGILTIVAVPEKGVPITLQFIRILDT